jgi:hypothetical protein
MPLAIKNRHFFPWEITAISRRSLKRVNSSGEYVLSWRVDAFLMMITFIFIIFLIAFFAAFMGLGYIFDVEITETTNLMAMLNDMGITRAHVQVLLGVGILFCQLAIILFSMLDKIGYAIKAMAVPLLRLVPLIAFLVSVWKTYSPVFLNLLPDQITEVFGVTKADNYNYMVRTIDDGTFTKWVVITLIAMLFFILFSYALRPGDSQRVKALKAENAKLRKQLRSF